MLKLLLKLVSQEEKGEGRGVNYSVCGREALTAGGAAVSSDETPRKTKCRRTFQAYTLSASGLFNSLH